MSVKQSDIGSQARMKRGLELLESKSKHIIEKADGSFHVPSQTSSNSYEVRLIGQSWVCTCPDFEYRQVEACKHIYAVRMQVATKTYLKDEPRPKVFADDAMPCDRCGSIRVIRYGMYRAKRVFYCKDCKHKFREPSIIKSKFTPELVTLTLDLYFSGLSLRKIARMVGSHFNIEIGYATIYRWIAKYIPVISEYVNGLAPQLSSTWHADELFVKLRGGTTVKNGYNLGYVWNLMDRETRLLITSKLTDKRDVYAAVEAFKEAAANAHGLVPEKVHTDSLVHYYSAVRRLGTGVEHVKDCGVNKHVAVSNNRIERLNGTLRERTKVQRGWKTVKTPLAEGNRIQYNFVKPHMALDGKTPAEVAGLEVRGWQELLKEAVKKKGGIIPQ